MTIEFEGPIWYWRGPAPFYFVTVPPAEGVELKAVQSMASYGWGCIPVTAWINDTDWTTSLFPKEATFIVPIKAMVRKAEGIDEGDTVKVRLEITLDRA